MKTKNHIVNFDFDFNIRKAQREIFFVRGNDFSIMGAS